jgi:hypothetical protein
VQTGAGYSIDENRINLVVTVNAAKFPKNECISAVNHIRLTGGVRDQKYYKGLKSSLWSRSFFQHGFDPSKFPEDYLTRLDKIIRIQITAVDYDSKTGKSIVSGCEGMLLSDKVMFTE